MFVHIMLILVVVLLVFIFVSLIGISGMMQSYFEVLTKDLTEVVLSTRGSKAILEEAFPRSELQLRSVDQLPYERPKLT